MRLLAILVCMILSSSAHASRSSISTLFPMGAQIIETRDISGLAKKDRVLVLWMTNASKNNRPDDYCGTAIYGDFWEGKANLSVVDSKAIRIVNSITLGPREFPFHVGNGFYFVPRLGKDGEGKPQILHLSDFTGEGDLAQFPTFDYGACGNTDTRLYGYLPSEDKIVQYGIEIIGLEKHNYISGVTKDQRVTYDIVELFAHRMTKPGHWDFIWGPGHGSDETDREIVSFDAKRKIFVDNVTVVTHDEPQN